MKNFWQNLPIPFVALAPMADVTDPAFRNIIASVASPDVFWTEFVSADGIVRAPKNGLDKILSALKFGKDEKPIVAQLFGSNPENMELACSLVSKMGFQGIDINMGCPDKSVEKQKAGAALIKDLDLAISIIESAKIGIRKSGRRIPLSVKTRLGYNTIDYKWIEGILKTKPNALTVHLRTRKDMSLVPAEWGEMRRVVKLRNKWSPKTILIGNGDVKNVDDAFLKCSKYGCEGAMIGRGIFGNPWMFKDLGRYRRSLNKNAKYIAVRNSNISVKDRLNLLVKHTEVFEKLCKYKNFAVMRKHFSSYVGGFNGAKELRMELMSANSAKQVKAIISSHLRRI